MKNNDFQPPNSKLSFLSVFGGLMTGISLIVGIELGVRQLPQTAQTEPDAAQLVLKSAPSNSSQP